MKHKIQIVAASPDLYKNYSAWAYETAAPVVGAAIAIAIREIDRAANAVAKSAKAIFQAPPWCPAAKRLTRLMIIGWLFSMV